MKRQYSFKDNTTYGSSLSKPNWQADYASNGYSKDAWTDIRIQEIKKKYQTPSGSQQKNHKSYRDFYGRPDYETRDKIEKQEHKYFKSKQNVRYEQEQNIPSFGIQNISGRGSFNQIPSKQFITPNRTSYGSSNISKSYSKIDDGWRQKRRNIDKDQQVFKSSLMRREQLRQINNFEGQSNYKVDPRVENIDRINSKIKKILECLHGEEKDHEKLGDRLNTNYNQIKRQSIKNSLHVKDFEVVSGGQNQEELEDTKILSKQKIYHGDFGYQNLNLKKSKDENMQSVFKLFGSKVGDDNLKKSREGTQKSRQSRVKSIMNKQHGGQNQSQWFQQKVGSINRSKSCLGGFKNLQNKQFILSSGKKVDDEITKLNDRIKKFQEEKRKLNINFKPFDLQNKCKRSTSTLNNKSMISSRPPLPKPRASDLNYEKGSQLKPHIRIRTQDSYSKQYKEGSYSKQYKEGSHSNQYKAGSLTQTNQIVTKYSKKSQNLSQEKQDTSSKNLRSSQASIRNSPQKTLFRNPSFQYDLNQQQKENEQSFSHKNNQCSQLKKEDSKFDKQFQNRAYEGIQNRKLKLMNIQTATTTFDRQTKRFIQSLFQQVILDEALRNSKIWFRDYYNLPDKWEKLRFEIEEQSLQVKQIKQQFQISQEQDNPFYSVRDSLEQSNIIRVIENWKKAQNFWKNNVINCYDLKEFEVQKFTLDKIDLEKKGYFSVEDLVRFLNMETGTFYRNRDLILIFRRFTKGTKLDWQTFLNLLKCDQDQPIWTDNHQESSNMSHSGRFKNQQQFSDNQV